MKRVWIASLLIACQAQTAPTQTTPPPAPAPSDEPWCAAAPERPGAAMPPLEPYAGALPPGPQQAEAVALVFASPTDQGRLWAVYVDGDQVVAWHDLERAAYAAYSGKLIDSLWGARWVPRINVPPPPPPVDGGGDLRELAVFFLEVARLERMIPAIAAERATAR